MKKSARDYYCLATIFAAVFSANAYSVALPQAPNNSFVPNGSANDANIQFQDQIHIQNMQHQLLTSPCQSGQWSQCNPDAVAAKQSISHTRKIKK